MAVLNAAANEILILDLEHKEEIKKIKEEEAIIAISLSLSGLEILLNTSFTDPHLSLYSITNLNLLQTYRGFMQMKFELKPCFIGPNQELIGCGSENGNIHL